MTRSPLNAFVRGLRLHVKSTACAAALVLVTPLSALAQQPAAQEGAKPSYPGIPPSQDTLEAEMGAFKVRLFGTILMNVSAADGSVFGQELPLWTLPSAGTITYPDGTTSQTGDNHDLIFSLRQSVFGFAVGAARPAAGTWVPSGLIEADFFGTRPVDGSIPQNRVLSQPRLRLAYFQIARNSVKLVFGQDKAILAPLDPISLSHVAAPLGATAGNLWAWLPQARVEFAKDMGNVGLLLQAGILRSQFGDPRLETAPAASTSLDIASSGLGERTTQPFYQARAAVSPKLRGRSATMGVSGHYGKEKIGVDRDLQSWAVALDADVPLDPHLVLRGEAFTGSNLIPFQGGIDQGAAVLTSATVGAPPLQINEIHAKGGWGEVTLLPRANGKDAVYVGMGVDKPRESDLLPGSGRAKNLFIWASYFHKVTDAVTLAVEWSNWQFETATFVNNAVDSVPPASKANVVNVSFAYQF